MIPDGTVCGGRDRQILIWKGKGDGFTHTLSTQDDPVAFVWIGLGWDRMEGLGVDRITRRVICLVGRRPIRLGISKPHPRYRTREPVSPRTGYHSGGTGVWTGYRAARCEKFSRTHVAIRDETSRIPIDIGDEGGLYHTMCRVGAAHLLLLPPSLFSNELRFASKHG